LHVAKPGTNCPAVSADVDEFVRRIFSGRRHNLNAGPENRSWIFAKLLKIGPGQGRRADEIDRQGGLDVAKAAEIAPPGFAQDLPGRCPVDVGQFELKVTGPAKQAERLLVGAPANRREVSVPGLRRRPPGSTSAGTLAAALYCVF